MVYACRQKPIKYKVVKISTYLVFRSIWSADREGVTGGATAHLDLFCLKLERRRGNDFKIKDLGSEGKIHRGRMMRVGCDSQLWE